MKKESFRMEQRSVILFLVAEKCKQCEIYRRMYDVCGKAYFNKKKKVFTYGLNMGLPLRVWVLKDSL